jgi:hypothetical protein
MCDKFINFFESEALFRKGNLPESSVYKTIDKIKIYKCECGSFYIKPFHNKRKDYIEVVRMLAI